jgi:7-cyano-7-deazaguanine synthase
MTDSSRAPAPSAADPRPTPDAPVAVLSSAGLDSAVLLAHLAQTAAVVPVYVRVGLAWEAAERATLAALLEAPVFAGRVEPLVALELDMRDVYPPAHWALTGRAPAYDTPDEDVYIVGRNIVLLTKAAIACAYRGVSRLAIGPLAGNPFPDATPEFFAAIGRSLSLGLDHPIAVEAPFAAWSKAEVIRRGVELGVPLERTLSCMSPVRRDGGWRACGACSKCRERHDAFAAAGLTDPAR